MITEDDLDNEDASNRFKLLGHFDKNGTLRVDDLNYEKTNTEITEAQLQDLKDLYSWLALLMFVSAVIGVVFCFVGGKNVSLIRLCAIVTSIVLGLIFFARGGFFKDWFKITGFGFYVIIVGWVLGVVGAITNK